GAEIEPSWRLRPSDEEALDQGTVELAQLAQLLESLHPFGDRLDADRRGQAYDRSYDLAVDSLFAEAPDEGPVDLDVVDREPLQIAERRVARSEIIDRHPYTERL